MRLSNEVHITNTAEAPYGKGVQSVKLNGQQLDEVQDVNIHFTADGLHEVTITLHAHVVVEEV